MTIIIRKPQCEIETGAKTTLQGRYRIVATKLDGRSRVVADWFENLILETGLVGMGLNHYCTTCVVGTGNAAPDTAQTSLQNLLASTTSVNSRAFGVNNGFPYYGWARRTYRFATGVATGVISEVGVGWSSVGLFSRSLIKDSEGNPTSMVILSDETLDVTYELRLYANTTDQVSVRTIGGAEHTCTIRPAGLSDTAKWGGDSTTTQTSTASSATGIGLKPLVFGVTDLYGWVVGATANDMTNFLSQPPTGGSSDWATKTIAEYINDKTTRGTATWGLNNGNYAGGIKAVSWTTQGLGTYQIGFDPPIPKTSVHIFTLNIAISWDRHGGG